MINRDDLVKKLVAFVREIGLQVYLEPIAGETVLPGILLREGSLVIDADRLLYPGDILHEAGHLAVLPVSIRKTMNDRLESNDIQQGGEIMAFAWSYAACIHLEIDPHIVFHEHGYQGGGKEVVINFAEGRTVGVPLMEWYGLTYTPETATRLKEQPFPNMVKWVCDMQHLPA